MTTPLVDPSLARSALNDHQIRDAQRMAQSTPLTSESAKQKQLRQACEGFEAVFIQKLWEGMRASLPKEGLMHSREEQFWQGMYDQELGKSLASAGGIGLADMMVSQMSRNLQNATQIATESPRKPMSIDPVPLLPTAQVQPQAQAAAPPKADTPPVTAAAPEPAPLNSVQTALRDLYSGAAQQPEAPDSTTQNASTPTAAVPNPTPPEIEAHLQAFRQQATPQTPASAQASGAPATNQAAAEPSSSSLMGLATSQAASGRTPGAVLPQPTPGLTRVTTVSNTPIKQQRVTRQTRAGQTTPNGAPLSRGMTTTQVKPQAQPVQTAPVVPTEQPGKLDTGAPAASQTVQPGSGFAG